VLADRSNDQSAVLSLSCKDAFVNTQVPLPTAEGIWVKASMLMGEENAVVVAPGCGTKDKMVNRNLALFHIWLEPQISWSISVMINAHNSNH